MAGSLHPKAMVTLLDAETGETRRTFDHPVPDEDVVGLAFAPGSRMLAAAFCSRIAGYHGRVRQWHVGTGTQGPELPQKVADGGFLCVAFSPDGSRLVTGGWDCVVRRLEAATGQECDVRSRAVGYLRRFALSPDGKTAACGGYDHTIQLFDLGTRQWGRTIQAHAEIWRLAFSADGQTLAARAGFGIQLWDVKTGSPRQSWLDVQGDRLAFRSDGKLLASAFWGTQDNLRLWDVAADKPGPQLEKVPGNLSDCVALNPDGTTLAAGFMDGSVILWDLATGKKKLQLTNPQGETFVYCYTPAFAPDGKKLAVAHAGSAGWTVKLWDVETGEVWLPLEGSNRAVTDLAFRADCKVLATAGYDDGTVRLWDATTGRSLQTFRLVSPAGQVIEVAFTAGGEGLAALNTNGTVSILRLAPP